MTRVLAIAVAVCPLALPSSGAQRKAEDTPRVSGPLVMTYWEAKAAGFDVAPLPSETGMRVCTDVDLVGGGFPSAEAAERSLAEYEAKWGESGSPADCQLDPRKARFLSTDVWLGRRPPISQARD